MHGVGAAPLDLSDEKTGDHMVVDWAIEQIREVLGEMDKLRLAS